MPSQGISKETESATKKKNQTPQPKTKHPNQNTPTTTKKSTTQNKQTHTPNQTIFIKTNHRSSQDFNGNTYSIVELAITMATPL